jgi:peptide/nickel transport system substrate-binding protein
LREAGWEDHDGDGVLDKEIDGRPLRFEFDLLSSNLPDRIKICTLLKDNLDQLGIVCNVRPLEFTVLQEKMIKHEFHAAFGGWGAGTDPDLSSNIFTTDAITNGRNFGQYSNPEVDALFKQGKREFDRAKRAEIYAQIDRILWEDQPSTWLYYRNAFYAFNKKLRGYNFSPRGPYGYGPGFLSIWQAVP